MQTNLFKKPEKRESDATLVAAQSIYALVSSGHDGLAYCVDRAGAALVQAGPRGQFTVIQGHGGDDAAVWQRAKVRMQDGREVDRKLNPWTLAQHLRGRYSVAAAAPSWVGWCALDIDAHPDPRDPDELGARRRAKAAADAVLAQVWRALGCSAERHPLVLRSPGGGYHVWFPLTRGPGSPNAEHTWPAAVVRAWFERVLRAAGVPIGPGILEIFPAGRCLRVPCGRGMQLLRALWPDDAEALGLQPWPGTVTYRRRPDGTVHAIRAIGAMADVFTAQWHAQRRPLPEWLQQPAAAWDPKWGFLGWRGQPRDEKNQTSVSKGLVTRSQELDEVSGGPEGRAAGVLRTAGVAGAGRVRRKPGPVRVSVAAQGGSGPLVYGDEFKLKINQYLTHGVTEASTRHDAVLALMFYWMAPCGLELEAALLQLRDWCLAHDHRGSRLTPQRFVKACLAEGAQYGRRHGPRWKFRGGGGVAAGGLRTLTAADETVVAQADARVHDEVRAVLRWLAGQAGADGEVAEPVQLASGLLHRLCGDRRVVVDGRRCRATTVAMAELTRLGVLALAQNYAVGRWGRRFVCWYRFGSGVLPALVAIPATEWAALAPASTVGPDADNDNVAASGVRPDPAAMAVLPASAAGAAAAVQAPVGASGEPSEPPEPAPVWVRVLGTRAVPEGTLQLLAAGGCALPRPRLVAAADVAPGFVARRAPWYARMYTRALPALSPLELRHADLARLVPLPDQPYPPPLRPPARVVPRTVALTPELALLAEVAAAAWSQVIAPRVGRS